MLDGLSRCEEFKSSPIYVFCDGPKQEADREAVYMTRQTIRDHIKYGAEIIEAKQNKGLARSIINGVTTLTEQFGRVIVVEDDLNVSPFFLQYMNSALDRYKEIDAIKQISGYMFPAQLDTKDDAVFLPFTTSWGWATWKRAWDSFDPNMSYYHTLAQDPALRKAYDFNGTSNQFKMLTQQKDGKLDSWAVRWYLSVFRQAGLVLHPTQTLVSNFGFDGSGTHSTKQAQIELTFNDKPVTNWPEEVEINQVVFNAIQSHLRRENSLFRKIVNRIRR